MGNVGISYKAPRRRGALTTQPRGNPHSAKTGTRDATLKSRRAVTASAGRASAFSLAQARPTRLPIFQSISVTPAQAEALRTSAVLGNPALRPPPEHEGASSVLRRRPEPWERAPSPAPSAPASAGARGGHRLCSCEGRSLWNARRPRHPALRRAQFPVLTPCSASNVASSPLSYISIMMSDPPTNSPFT